ncbi:unnamed protein product [Cyprideis torosa]|uniref:Uncharacterized protein n=1 Tax=Cyprideis torosa TaxID=163714 RepID=A0A7R8ZQ54_9CRUS|nr:unnamed protein product [Cyprideis torosa]CAG0891329.1 unnamed protein product [Cyprideis torosa]
MAPAPPEKLKSSEEIINDLLNAFQDPSDDERVRSRSRKKKSRKRSHSVRSSSSEVSSSSSRSSNSKRKKRKKKKKKVEKKSSSEKLSRKAHKKEKSVPFSKKHDASVDKVVKEILMEVEKSSMKATVNNWKEEIPEKKIVSSIDEGLMYALSVPDKNDKKDCNDESTPSTEGIDIGKSKLKIVDLKSSETYRANAKVVEKRLAAERSRRKMLGLEDGECSSDSSVEDGERTIGRRDNPSGKKKLLSAVSEKAEDESVPNQSCGPAEKEEREGRKRRSSGERGRRHSREPRRHRSEDRRRRRHDSKDRHRRSSGDRRERRRESFSPELRREWWDQPKPKVRSWGPWDKPQYGYHDDELDRRRPPLESGRKTGEYYGGRRRSPSPYSWRRSRRRRSPSFGLKIDKEKLLKIARINAAKMLQNKDLPPGVSRENLRAIQQGGRSLDELTQFCRKLQTSGELDTGGNSGSDSDAENGLFVRHPFVKPISSTTLNFNVKDLVPLPVKTPEERAMESSKLRLQFPVSSGMDHRAKELEWVPAEPKKPESTEPETPAPKRLFQEEAPEPKEPGVPGEDPPVAPVEDPAAPLTLEESAPSIAAHSLPPTFIGPVKPTGDDDKVFPDVVEPTMSLSEIVSQRLSAVRRLQENPVDTEALSLMYKLQKEMNAWATSKQQPGQFTGSTNAPVLTGKELSTGKQAWVKKDLKAKRMMEKMGWRPGEGLGKQRDGPIEPLTLDIKLDKSGVMAEEEAMRYTKSGVRTMHLVRDLGGKHPVSALMELTAKRRWGAPSWETMEVVSEGGRKFLMKVTVNGREYQPTSASTTKKQAKAMAATVCLQSFGLLPSGNPATMVGEG